MADTPKPALAADSSQDSPQLAHLKFKRDEMVKKLAFLDTQENSEAHDIDNAKKRTRAAITSLEAQIKQGGK